MDIRFGALVKPLVEQVGPVDGIELFQRLADAITLLRVQGLISREIATRAERRLAHEISLAVFEYRRRA